MIELETPKIEPVAEAGTYAKYEAGPLQAGYGVTLGNALRRILLSSMPGAAITEAVIHERLLPAGVPDSMLAQLHELFQCCNLARYAPEHTPQELSSLIPRVEEALRALQQLNAETPKS